MSTLSSHYNLKLYAGSDKFNPITFEKYNEELIDAGMFANKQRVVGNASETVVGTAHAIVRTNTDSPIFCFTATVDWAEGDTMSVDGTSVTVYTPNGESLGDGAITRGCVAICVIVGTVVTVFTSNSSVSYAENAGNAETADNATNAGKLNNQLPTYYATSADMNKVLGAITPCNLLDNGWFTVNQRGVTSWVGGQYGADRWKQLTAGSDLATINNTTHIVSMLATSELEQKFEDMSYYFNKKMTASVMLNDGTIITGTQNLASAQDTVFVENANIKLYFKIADNALCVKSITGFQMKAVKFELGEVSTLANDSVPNYAEELVRCQRYCYVLNNLESLVGYTISQTASSFVLPSVNFRGIPTASFIGNLRILTALYTGNATSCVVEATQFGNYRLYVENENLGGANYPANLIVYGENSKLILSADL